MQMAVPHFQREVSRFTDEIYPRHGGGSFHLLPEGRGTRVRGIQTEAAH